MRVLVLDFDDTLCCTTHLLKFGSLPSSFIGALYAFLTVALAVTDGCVYIVSSSSKGWLEGCVDRFFGAEVRALFDLCKVRLVPKAHQSSLGLRMKEPTLIALTSECYVVAQQPQSTYTPTNSSSNFLTARDCKDRCPIQPPQIEDEDAFDDESIMSVLLVGDSAEDVQPAAKIRQLLNGCSVRVCKLPKEPSAENLEISLKTLTIILAGPRPTVNDSFLSN